MIFQKISDLIFVCMLTYYFSPMNICTTCFERFCNLEQIQNVQNKNKETSHPYVVYLDTCIFDLMTL